MHGLNGLTDGCFSLIGFHRGTAVSGNHEYLRVFNSACCAANSSRPTRAFLRRRTVPSYLASSSAFDPRRRERSPLIPQKSISRFHDGPQPSGALNMIRLETGNGGMVEPLARRAETKIRRGDKQKKIREEKTGDE